MVINLLLIAPLRLSNGLNIAEMQKKRKKNPNPLIIRGSVIIIIIIIRWLWQEGIGSEKGSEFGFIISDGRPYVCAVAKCWFGAVGSAMRSSGPL